MAKSKPINDEAVASATRDQAHVDLLGLGPRLREHAARKRITFAAALRTAIVPMLDAEHIDGDAEARDDAHGEATDGPKVVRVLLRLSAALASEFLTRARARGISRSQYFGALLAGAEPPALPADHASMIAALMASTDRLAAMSVDVNAFMRLLGRVHVPNAELERYRAGLMSLASDVRAHLVLAATVLAELDKTRRWR